MLVSCGGPGLPENIVELPLVWHEGYGPVTGIHSGYISLQQHPMENYLRLEAGPLPDDIFDAEIGVIILNHYQLMYQGHLAGKTPQDMYDYYSKAWDNYDESMLSPEPLKCYILVAIGKDAEGNARLIVDANANNDFTDDPAVQLSDYDAEKYYPVMTEYDRYVDGKVHRLKRPLVIFKPFRDGADYTYHFYDHATIEKEGKVVGVVGNSRMEQDRDFEVGQIANGDTAKPVDAMLTPGEYLMIDSTYYKILDMNGPHDRIRLERMPEGKLYSTQVGMEPHPFSGTDMVSGEQISLEELRGKYVYIDFWSDGCGPCIAEMPTLNAIYEGTDRSQIAFIGIADGDESRVRQVMERQGVNWPTILNTAENDIIKRYNVTGFPTTFIVGPDGTVLLNSSSCYIVGELYRLGAVTAEQYKTLSKQIHGWDVYLEGEEPEA